MLIMVLRDDATGESNKTKTLFLSHAPAAVKEVSDQIMEAMLVAGRAKG